MRKRAAKDEDLPADLASDLNEHFLQTLYFRFEFARGAVMDDMDLENFHEEGDGKPRLFKRIHARRSFLPDGRRSSSYLSDLRDDIRDAGKQRDVAREGLRYYVEHHRCPLTYCLSVIFYAEKQAAFFPEARRGKRPDAATKAWTRRYCFELFELQDYLINEIGVKPGSLLPVWVSSEGRPGSPDSDTNMPVISFLPVAQTTVGVLVRYLTWEYGSDRGDWYSRSHRIPEGPKKGQRLTLDPKVLHRALAWGRRFQCREVKIMSLEEGTGLSIEEFAALSPEERRRAVLDAHKGEPDADVRRSFFDDVTHSREAERLLGIMKGLRSDPVRSRRPASAKGEADGDSQTDELVNDLERTPLHMENIDKRGGKESLVARNKHFYEGLDRTALPLADYLYRGGYRDLW
jgi:hypothetical protein